MPHSKAWLHTSMKYNLIELVLFKDNVDKFVNKHSKEPHQLFHINALYFIYLLISLNKKKFSVLFYTQCSCFYKCG